MSEDTRAMADQIAAAAEWISSQWVGSPDAVVERLVGIYLEAKREAVEWDTLADSARARILEVMEEAGVDTYTVSTGKVTSTKPSTRTSFDVKALEVLMGGNAKLAEMLSPYRKVTQVPGGIKISANK